MPSRVLILFAHPMSPRSLRANRAPAEAVRGMDGVTFHDLGEAHLDFDQLRNLEDADAT